MKTSVTAISFVLLISSLNLSAQSPTAVPVPAQLTTAHTVFVGNAGGPDNALSSTAYFDLYQDIATWNHFQLTTTPANADLAFEISASKDVTGSSNGYPTGSPLLRLDVRDVKTQILVWSFSESVVGTSPTTASAKNIAAAVSKLTADLNALLNQSSSIEAPAKKQRLSGEGKK